MRLTRRGKVVVAIALLLALWGIIEISANLWVTPQGYCWGSIEKCEGGL